MKQEKNQQKIIETKALLLKIIKKPKSYKDDADLIKAIKTQAGLAKYHNEALDISLCSLNTFKSNAELLLNRGFIEINELRINAKDAIEAAIIGAKPLKNTKTGLLYKVNVIKAENETLKKTNFLLSMLIKELQGELKAMTHSTDNIELRQRKFDHINKTVEAKLSYTLYGEL